MTTRSPALTRVPPLVRRSPVVFDAIPATTESRDGWEVVTAYADESPGPWLVDLSHRARWDVQDRRIDDERPFGLTVPARPGEVSVAAGLMINRMNRTQAAIWHVGPGAPPETATRGGLVSEPSPGATATAGTRGPVVISYTLTTDSHCWLAVVGREAPSVMERATSLDLFPPGRPRPFLTQGPVLHVPCQVVTWARDLVLIACARGYGRTFAGAFLHAARDAGLRPAGEAVFSRRVAALQTTAAG